MFSLSASGLNIYQVLLSIISDIVMVVVEGFNGLDLLGQNDLIFLDIFSNVWNSPSLRTQMCFSWVIQQKLSFLSASLDVGRGHKMGSWSHHPIFTVDVCLLYASMNK